MVNFLHLTKLMTACYIRHFCFGFFLGPKKAKKCVFIIFPDKAEFYEQEKPPHQGGYRIQF